MTAQIGDTFRYKKSEYNIVAISNPLEFNPQQYGITPKACCSGCWAGYWCEYEISDKGIVLTNLYINSKDSNYPEINGVRPLSADKKTKEQFTYMGHHKYKGINIKIPYTGKIVVGKDFLQQYYIHMGYQRAWSYETLREFIFDGGSIVDVVDHSDMAKMLRKQIDEDSDFWDKIHSNIPVFVNNSFDLSLVTKAWWVK